MTLNDNWLPSSRHILNLIQHGEKLIDGTFESNPSISLIVIDNSVELLLREYLRYYKNTRPSIVENLNFHDLLARTSDLQTVSNYRTQFQAFHDIRNNVYHTGMSSPLVEDVLSALSFTKKLFNELHTEHQISVKLQLPTEKTIDELNKLSHGKYSEFSFITQFAKKFEVKGYSIKIESRLGKNLRADLIMEKNDHVILCEFKKIADNVDKTSFGQLLSLKAELEKESSNAKITLWLVSQGKFNFELINTAKKVGITLIDDQNLDEFTGDSALYMYTDKSVIMQGKTFSIFVRVDKIETEAINIKIKNMHGNIIHSSKLSVKDTNWISETITASGPEWAIEGAEFQVIAEYGEKTTSVSIWRSDFGATIELDQKAYTWTDKVYITIVVPDLNRDSNSVETIGDRPDSKITISTSKGTLSNYSLVETGKNTGIFVGEVILTGFPNYSAINEVKDAWPSGITGGSGPDNGLLGCDNNDCIKVTLSTLSRNITSSSIIRWNIGEIFWDMKKYRLGDTGIITVVDPDVNLNPQLIDIFHIRVKSDSDTAGVKVLVVETGPATGIFVGDIQFGMDSEDEGQIKVLPGDSVVATYYDKTLPPPYQIGKKLEIKDTSTITANAN